MTHVLNYDKVNKEIEVPISYGTEITIQHLLNDIRDFEDELSSMDIPYIASCAGKEALGGGITVGLTLTLLDGWHIKFEDRAGPDYIACLISGGNLVTEDGSIPYLGSAYVTVGLSASSSATTSDLAAIQYSSYGGMISIDVINGQSGTDYPIGNQEYPVDNLADAVTIANERGIKSLSIRENMTLSTETVSKLKINGSSHVNTEIIIDTSLVCDNITISNCKLMGVLDGGTEIEDCVIGDLNYVNGHIHNSGLQGTITLDGNKNAFLGNCKQNSYDDIPVVDLGGSGQDLVVDNYSGIIYLKNLTGGNDIGIGLSAGRIVLETSTVTNGIIHVSGIGKLMDENGDYISSGVWNGGVTIINELNDNDTIKASRQVYLDVVNGISGTSWPAGTETTPSNNLQDSLDIGSLYGITDIHLKGALTINGEDLTGISLHSSRSTGNIITIISMVNTGISYFTDLTVSGTLTGGVRFTTCVLGAITNFDGGAKNCLLTGTLTFTGLNNNYLTECDTYVTSSNFTELYLNAATLNIIRGRGRFGIYNKTSTTVTAIDLVSGYVYVDSTCNSGEIHVGGISTITDSSSAGCTVKQGALNVPYIVDSVWDELTTNHTTSGTTGKALTDAGASGNPWSTPISGNTVAGTFGEKVGKKLLSFSKWFGLK